MPRSPSSVFSMISSPVWSCPLVLVVWPSFAPARSILPYPSMSIAQGRIAPVVLRDMHTFSFLFTPASLCSSAMRKCRWGQKTYPLYCADDEMIGRRHSLLFERYYWYGLFMPSLNKCSIKWTPREESWSALLYMSGGNLWQACNNTYSAVETSSNTINCACQWPTLIRAKDKLSN